MRGLGLVLAIVALVVAAGFSLASAVIPPLIFVDSTADPAEAGKTTLRDAINTAIGTPWPDTIYFDPTVFPSGAGTTIAVGSQLPALLSVVVPGIVIDGTNGGSLAPGSVILDGSSLSGSENGLVLSGASLTVFGLGVRNFPGAGILVSPAMMSLFGYSNINILDNLLDGNTVGIQVIGSFPGGLGGNFLDGICIVGNTLTNHTDNGISVQGAGGAGAPGGNVILASVTDNVVNGVTNHNGIQIDGGNEGGGGNTIECDILRNLCQGAAGNGIDVNGGVGVSGGNTVAPFFSENTCSSNGGVGIMVGGGSEGSAGNYVEVNIDTGNVCTANGIAGVILYGGYDGSADNEVLVPSIMDNDFSSNPGGGISIFGSIDPSPGGASHSNSVAVSLMGNTIADNDGQGLLLALYNQGLNTDPGSFVYVDLGGGASKGFGVSLSDGRNTITGNGASPSDIVNNIPADVLPSVMAVGNTFDHTNPADIDSIDIFDDDEDSNYGPVLFGEYMDGLVLQKARPNVRRGRLILRGWFRPALGGDGVDPTSEVVHVGLFDDEGFAFGDTIPAGSFTRKGRSRSYMFTGGAPGGVTKAKLVEWNGGKWLYTIWARGIDLADWSTPLTVHFGVGDDVKATSYPPK